MSRDGHQDRERKPRPPLDQAHLEALAVHYVGRYATTRARLAEYLRRKLAERGWAGESAPEPALLAERLAGLGYIDDRAFASARAASLVRRGYGRRRVSAALDGAGVAIEDRDDAEALSEAEGFAAALALARRRRIGPFASEMPDRAGRERAIAVLIRAGHDFVTARRIASAAPGEIPGEDAIGK